MYIMSNVSYPFIKIGMTSKDPHDRAKELYTTGVPTKFVVEYSRYTYDHAMGERRIFSALNDYRVSPNREFFSTTVGLAMDTMDAQLSEIEGCLSKLSIGTCSVIPSTDA